MTRAFLDKTGVTYRDVDVGEDMDAAREMVRISGQMAVPVIVYGDEVIVGFDATRLRELFGAETATGAYDVLILGGGPAGLTAAVYCGRKLLRTCVVTATIGGQALETWAVENYMGYRVITGEDLMEKFEAQVREQEIDIELGTITAVESGEGIFTVHTDTGGEYQGRSLIIASGRRPRRLNVDGEEKFWGRGVSVCATCDAPLFRDRNVVVVGGGNSALTTAIEMSRIARSVTLVVRSRIRADETYQRRYEEAEGIRTLLNHEIVRFEGDTLLSGIIIRDRETGAETKLGADGVFIEIGQEPNTGFLQGFVDLNPAGEVIVDCDCTTSLGGVFAAGDVTSVTGKQIIIAAGEGAKAGLGVYRYLMER